MNTLYELRISPIYAIFKVIPIMALSLLFTVLGDFVYLPIKLLSLPVMVWAAYRYFSYYFVRYDLSVNALIVRTGILARRFDNLELYRVKDIVVKQPLWMRLFKLMNLTLITTDPSDPSLTLIGIPTSHLQETFSELVREARLKNTIIELS